MTISRAESFLKTLVDSSSATTSIQDVEAAHKLLADALVAMNFKITWHDDPSKKSAPLLVAEREGTESAKDPTAFITCVSHIDTVLSTSEAGPYRQEASAEGLLARGAGIIDNKGGLAVLIESLRIFYEANPEPHFGFRVVSSPDEENGSSAWHQTFADIGQKSKAVLGFEPALDDGSIISSRRGNRWYDIVIKGKEAHAGRCKGEEINAAHEAGQLIARMISLRDGLREKLSSPPGLGVSLQVGHIEGGRNRHNVVCGEVKLKVDTRFSNFQERDLMHQQLLDLLSSPVERDLGNHTAEIQFTIVDDCPPFDVNPKTEKLVSELCEIISKSENQVATKAAKAGGAGDVNHMSRPGLLVLDGLGPVGGRMHTTEEFLRLSTLQTRANALATWYPLLLKTI